MTRTGSDGAPPSNLEELVATHVLPFISTGTALRQTSHELKCPAGNRCFSVRYVASSYNHLSLNMLETIKEIDESCNP